ncbi:MAG TPA: hypothetical protein VF472_00535 [Burkholderiaceae bacterium]
MTTQAKRIAAFFLTCFVATSHASTDPAWLFQNLNKSDVIAQSSQGKIDGETYTAVVANRRNPKEELHPVVVIFSSRDGRHKLLTEFDIENGVSSKIENNSIYIRQDYAHHGIRFIQYQFKRVGGEFKMIGIESQDMSSSDYGGVSEIEREAPNYRSQEMWSGISTNLLTARSECWLKMFDIDYSQANPNQQDEAQSLFYRGARPKNAVTGEIRFSTTELLPLSKFASHGFRANYFYPSCYFDYHKHLHKITSPPK